MLKIIIPMCGSGLYSQNDSFSYPKILTEILNKTLLEYSVDCYGKLAEDYEVIFIVPEDKSRELGLKSIINLISRGKGKVVELYGFPKGSLCTVLSAIDFINDDDELIVSSADHYIEDDINEVLDFFRKSDADAGVISFQSVHPKWSYIIKGEDGCVVEAVEKKVVSRDALIGFTYFKLASEFICSAKNSIRKGSEHEGLYYLSSCLNQLSLAGRKIFSYESKSKNYYSFYDEHAIKSFEDFIITDDALKERAETYVTLFNNRDMSVLDLFDANAKLKDPNVFIEGRKKIHLFLKEFFDNTKNLHFSSRNIYVSRDVSIIEFALNIDGEEYFGVDLIKWDNNKIVRVDAYFY